MFRHRGYVGEDSVGLCELIGGPHPRQGNEDGRINIGLHKGDLAATMV